MERSRIALLIPAFNESETIGQVITQALHYVDDVVVVDDCSSDDTELIATKLGAVVLRNDCNRGYSESLNVGFAYCFDVLQVDWLITIDADNEHNPQDIPRFISEIDEPTQLIFGSRNRPARKIERLLGMLMDGFLGVNDIFCGFNAYSKGVYKCWDTFDPCESAGSFVVINQVLGGASFKQIPLSYAPVRNQSRFSIGGLRSTWLLVRCLCSALIYSLFRMRL